MDGQSSVFFCGLYPSGGIVWRAEATLTLEETVGSFLRKGKRREAILLLMA